MSDSLIKLGFGPMPGVTYIFVGGEDDAAEHGACWYRLDESKKIPIIERSLTGYLRNIKIVPKPKYKGKPGEVDLKVDFYVEADKQYVIRSGCNTNFSRGIILDLNSIAKEALQSPLMFTVSPGDEPKIVFGKLFFADGQMKIPREWDSQIQLFPLVQELQKRLNVVAQTKDDLKLSEPPPPKR
jgi:hypothetical protein